MDLEDIQVKEKETVLGQIGTKPSSLEFKFLTKLNT